MLFLNNEEIVKLHVRNLHQEAERFKFGQQVLATKKELSKLDSKAKKATNHASLKS
ncbi:hypothetical protein J2T13_002646 [Paenibacillus sp. DS2015]|uniref:hypothetical protein n=1 Tax=Paenibacillus sp. DS2015 TaxID=3373917 RepID=UPI003D247DC2